MMYMGTRKSKWYIVSPTPLNCGCCYAPSDRLIHPHPGHIQIMHPWSVINNITTSCCTMAVVSRYTTILMMTRSIRRSRNTSLMPQSPSGSNASGRSVWNSTPSAWWSLEYPNWLPTHIFRDLVTTPQSASLAKPCHRSSNTPSEETVMASSRRGQER